QQTSTAATTRAMRRPAIVTSTDRGAMRFPNWPRLVRMETFVTLVLADSAPELAEAHDELYPVRVEEGIPLSLTLLTSFVPPEDLTDEHVEALRAFFASRRPLEFDLVRLEEFPGVVVYA